MVHAEKLASAEPANTRWRDFADIYLLAARHNIPGGELQSAISRVAAHRQAELAPLHEILGGYPAIAQPRWAAWRRYVWVTGLGLLILTASATSLRSLFS